MNIGIILAAGASSRFKSATHKQYLKLNGKEVIYYSISAMREANVFDEIIAVVDEDEYKEQYIERKYYIKCIPGGKSRNYSIYNALQYVKENYNAENIVFHDCSRPFIDKSLFKKFIDILEAKNGVALCSNIVDSLVTPDGHFVDRRNYLLIKTPEALKFDALYNDFNPRKKDTAIIHQLKEKSNIVLYNDNSFDFKITYPEDLFLAEQLMRIDYMRTTSPVITEPKPLGKILLFGGSGGIGQALVEYFKNNNVEYFAPSSKVVDLSNLSIEKLREVCPFEPDIIINSAAAYADDAAGLIETFDKIINVNLKSNLYIFEYAKSLNKRVNIVLLSSSSSTRGRENLTNYSAAKAALNSIIESQGKELAKHNIYLNAIIPEKINTPLIEKLHKTSINARELLDVKEVIDAIVSYSLTNEHGKLVHIRKGL